MPRFKYELLPSYPHLSAAETLIWNRFIEKYPEFCEAADYDVVVGDEPDMDDKLDPEWRKNAEYLGRYKIDVVGYKEKTHFVFEIKQRAHPRAIGQVMAYMSMYQELIGEEIDAEPIIVTDQERPNMRKLCEEHDIGYFIV